MRKKSATKKGENPLLNHLLDKAKAMEGARQIAAGTHLGDWPRRVWVISDGTPGMLSQCLALLRAMGLDGEDIRAVPTPLLRAFPTLARIPGWQLTLGRAPDWLKMNQWPDLCITCGRRMAGISIGVRRRSGGKTKTIHIQDPKVDARYFDLLITPRHDDIAAQNALKGGQLHSSENGAVLATTGALNRLSAEEINEAASAVAAAWPELAAASEGAAEQAGGQKADKHKLAAVMVGGHNRRYKAGEREFTQLADQLAAFAALTGAKLALVPSRRTPKKGLRVLSEGLRARIGAADGLWVWDGDLSSGAGAINPYPGVLGLADFIVVTSDSVNMTSEAAITGKPVLTAEMVPETGRIARFHAMMRSSGHTADLGKVLDAPGQLDEPFTPLDERAAIAEAVWGFFDGTL